MTSGEPERAPRRPPWGTAGARGADMSFRCATTERDGWWIVALEGELDWARGHQVRTTLLRVPLRRGGRLALDITGLTFMDSTGIRVVLQALAFAGERDAAFALVRGGHPVQRVLELVGLAEQLRIVNDASLLA